MEHREVAAVSVRVDEEHPEQEAEVEASHLAEGHLDRGGLFQEAEDADEAPRWASMMG